MNVDTGQFQALTARVEAIELRLQREARIAELVRNAGLDDRMADALSRQAEREQRHLRPVE